MAEGKSNRGIAEALVVSEAAVEKHVTSIFRKLEIEPTTTVHRRVLAVLRYLSASRSLTGRSRRAEPAERREQLGRRATQVGLAPPACGGMQERDLGPDALWARRLREHTRHAWSRPSTEEA